MRNKELLKEVISQILEAICEQEAVIKKYKGHIPQIELDLIMENIRKLYENFQFLNKYNQEIFAEEEEEEGRREMAEGRRQEEESIRQEEEGRREMAEGRRQEEESIRQEEEGRREEEDTEIEKRELEEGIRQKAEDIREKIAAEVEKEVEELSLPDETPVKEEEIFIPKSSIDIGFERLEEEEEKEEEGISDKAEDHIEEIVVEAEQIFEHDTLTIQEQKITPSNNTIKSTLDLFSESVPTIADTLTKNESTVYDKLGNGADDSVASKIQQVPIQDLKSHIGINDRFLFMNELFLGNMKEYNDAIETLNNFNNQEEAMAYFELLSEKYQMNESQDSFFRLKDFIQRRYL